MLISIEMFFDAKDHQICVNKTVQLLYISINLLMEDYLWWALIDHVIVDFQSVPMVQNMSIFK